jgi:bacitracin transport system permease protein
VSLRTVIFRNLVKNLQNYFLYVFALIFSVALYFSFVTLQYDPSMDETKGSVKGAAALGAASVMLIAIVAVFLLYANTIFIKRRSKEIGLLQLVGLTKARILFLLTVENLILYASSLVVGIAVGFTFSRLLLMILFRIIGVEEMASLRFLPAALLQTLIVFAAIYALILIMNFLFIRRQSLLSLFRIVTVAQQRVQPRVVVEWILGISGIGFILFGYLVSANLFMGGQAGSIELMFKMIFILATVNIGTYLFFKGSVSVILNAIRKSKSGYLSIAEVLSLSTIMFRMKTNALLLTVITTVSALSIGLLSLSAISYYSTEAKAIQDVPHAYTFAEAEDKERFLAELDARKIAYDVIHRQPVYAEVDVSALQIPRVASPFKDGLMVTPVLGESMVEGVKLAEDEALFLVYSQGIQGYLGLEQTGEIELLGLSDRTAQQLIATEKKSVLVYEYGAGKPTMIVDDAVYERLAQDRNPAVQNQRLADYYGVNLVDKAQQPEAEQLFAAMNLAEKGSAFSQYDALMFGRLNMGLMMFVVGFLGLAFLITSGCILYFKQMDESEEEKPNYTILRKLGFTQGDLLRGIRFKQLFNFGIPLVLGLSHGYFAVKSGWFFFGTELVGPMILVMVVYTVLYSGFGILSVRYYKRVIQDSL